MERYASFAIGFLCLWNLVSCKQQQLFCKTVDDSYTEPVRSPESVDYDKINQLVSEEVASGIAYSLKRGGGWGIKWTDI